MVAARAAAALASKALKRAEICLRVSVSPGNGTGLIASSDCISCSRRITEASNKLNSRLMASLSIGGSMAESWSATTLRARS